MYSRSRSATARAPWAVYHPSEAAPWDLRRVVHLHRCAGFGAPWNALERDLRDGIGPSVDRLLHGTSREGTVPASFAQVSAMAADAAIATNDPERLKAWWIYRMLFGPDPLGERLTLMWHNHFATSNAKVNDLSLMRQQNEAFRKLARGRFADLLEAAVRDPALSIWLDAQSNRREHPNENLARELLELFTLGIGHFSETDVKQAARALTGWTITGKKFVEDTEAHDTGEKMILARRGNWSGTDLLKMLVENPATALRLAWRICDTFLGEEAVSTTDIAALASGLRQRDLDIAWGVETVVRSDAFFAEDNLGRRVLSPVEYVVGAISTLELNDPPPSTVALAEEIALQGQDLFYPPNVGGWPGGRGWLEPRALVRRANFAAALVAGRITGRDEPFAAEAFAARHGRKRDRAGAIGFLQEVLLGAQREPGTRATIPTPATLLASPQAQLF
jgi:uncharacterized protein (DUF1800 family)